MKRRNIGDDNSLDTSKTTIKRKKYETIEHWGMGEEEHDTAMDGKLNYDSVEDNSAVEDDLVMTLGGSVTRELPGDVNGGAEGLW